MSYLEMAKQAHRDEPKPKEPTHHASVTDINAACPAERDPEDLRLIAAGWTPKDRCGPKDLTIWANPETGFYCSRDVALHRLEVLKNAEG